jgi:hypothetical protein
LSPTVGAVAAAHSLGVRGFRYRYLQWPNEKEDVDDAIVTATTKQAGALRSAHVAQHLEEQEAASGVPLLSGKDDGMLSFHPNVHFSRVAALEAQFASRPPPPEEAIVALVPSVAAGFRSFGRIQGKAADGDPAARFLEEAARWGEHSCARTR